MTGTDEFMGANVTGGRHVGTGLWIRDYLLKHKKDYIMSIWRAFCKFMAKKGYKKPSYTSFSNYIRLLRRVGLLENVGRRVASRLTAYHKVYVRIVPGTEESEIWKAPQQYMYPDTKLGSKRYDEYKSRMSSGGEKKVKG